MAISLLLNESRVTNIMNQCRLKKLKTSSGVIRFTFIDEPDIQLSFDFPAYLLYKYIQS